MRTMNGEPAERKKERERDSRSVRDSERRRDSEGLAAMEARRCSVII